MSKWIYVCEKDEVDFEDLKRFDYENKTYCIYNIKEGFFATDGYCTHEEVHLEDGLVIDNEIECPMHQGIFDIKTGKVIQDPPCEDLKTYSVKIEDNKVYIEID
ncbi:MAG: Rieske family ferredoxin [Pelagibacteraceae bacterium]|nr:Rieske family ferredoxin [Pelagibacteraceae bacterium]|tara:strand:- start:11277 stop:11588 length:312 start_codon:yes stop_codon:yes gene_type:complete